MFDSLRPFRGVLIAGLAIGGLRYALDFLAPDVSHWVGLYYLIPVVWLVAGARGVARDLPWSKLLPRLYLVGVLIWFPVSFTAYTTGQFLRWDFGRYEYDEEYFAAREAFERQVASLPPGSELPDEKSAIRSILGRESHNKTPFAPGQTPWEKLRIGLITALAATFFGALWCMLWGAAAIGLPNALRTRPSG